MTLHMAFLLLCGLGALYAAARRFSGDVRILKPQYRDSPHAPAYLRKTAVYYLLLGVVAAALTLMGRDPEFAYTHKLETLLVCVPGLAVFLLLGKAERDFVRLAGRERQDSEPGKNFAEKF